MKLFSLIAVMVSMVAGSLCTEAYATILPPNNYKRPDRPGFQNPQINEAKFNQIVDEVIAAWQPIAKLHGATLSANKLWKDETVNASAQQSGKNWIVNMYGGLARMPEVTPDGFALVVCHELGHHFGGYFFYGNREWASSEGQSDYFATHTCAHKLWERKGAENAQIRRKLLRFAPDPVKTQCDGQWKDPADKDICLRSAAAGYSLSLLLAHLGREADPKFETPDPSKVSRSSASHPRAQCRLDTYFSGALCQQAPDLKIIPAKGYPDGQNSPGAEAFATQYSCFASKGHVLGNRPGCWFKPLNN